MKFATTNAVAALGLTLALIVPAADGSRLVKPARSIALRVARVQRLLDEWRVNDAEAAMAKLLKRAPVNGGVLAAKGRLLFYRGRYTEALELLRKAALAGVDTSDLRNLERLVRSTAETVEGYVETMSAGGHFRIRTSSDKDELLAPFAGETLEAMRDRLGHDLGYTPPDTIVVEIYPKPADLARVSALTVEDIRRTGTIALCKHNRLMIVSPRALLRGYTWRDTLAHEYVHWVVGRLSHNRMPIWLHEGLAKFFEARWRDDAATPPPLSPAQQYLLADALAQRSLIPWDEMYPSMAKLPSQRATALAFAQVQTAVAMIATRGGVRGLRTMITSIRKGTDVWRAVDQATGLRRETFRPTWLRYLRHLHLRRLPGLIPPEHRFGGHLSKEQQIAEIRQQKARNYFRLADMLRQRELTRAAVIEYRKALALAGKREAFVANALARAYLETGRADEAIQALLPVIEYYPDLAGPQTTIGVAYLRHGDKNKAVAHLRRALGINPYAPELHCALVQSLPASVDRDLHQRICSELARN